MAARAETVTFPVVAAIDFGTARSGYGFAFTANPDDVFCPTDWVGGQGLVLKTLTNILIDKKTNKYTHFGYEAREEYFEQCVEGEPGLFFENFKMSLYNKKHGVEDLLTAACGKQIGSKIVFREALVFMKDSVLEKINEASAGEKLAVTDVMWVVSVPGMWPDKAKAIMKQAAEDAGMGTCHNLLLALEPEAASFHVRSEVKEADLPVGGKYIVVDCGGGTVDFACHKICEDGIVETHPADGGPWGSTFIDAGFISLMCDIFTKETITNFKNKNPPSWLQFMSNWESAKLSVKDFKKGRSVHVQLPYSLLRHLGEHAGIRAKCASFVKSEKAKELNQSVKFSERLKLDGSTLKSLFMPLLKNISTKIEELLDSDEVRDSTHIFIVGGFAKSKVVQTYLKPQFLGLTAITPLRPGLSVIKGSVKFGLHPSNITARRSRHTYGFCTTRKFIEGTHPASKEVTYDGEYYCRDIFTILVHKGQTVGINESFSTRRIPAGHKQTEVYFRFFISSETDPSFTTDDGCQEIGELRITNLPPGDKNDKDIVIEMKFGGTAIAVTARLVKDGRSCETTFDYQ